jgi:hypothetical protein
MEQQMLTPVILSSVPGWRSTSPPRRRGNEIERGRTGAPAPWGRKPRACRIEYGTVAKKDRASPHHAQDAVADLQHGLDSARRLVERTRFLLAGDAAAQEGDALAADPAIVPEAAPQAATSETVQNPSGE